MSFKALLVSMSVVFALGACAHKHHDCSSCKENASGTRECAMDKKSGGCEHCKAEKAEKVDEKKTP